MIAFSTTPTSVTTSKIVVSFSADKYDRRTAINKAGAIAHAVMRKYPCPASAKAGSCPIRPNTAPDHQFSGNDTAKNIRLSQKAIRVVRRARVSSPLAEAAATIGITAKPKPAPMMKIRNHSEFARTEAASALTSYHPNMIVSVIWIRKLATALPTKGKPSVNNGAMSSR